MTNWRTTFFGVSSLLIVIVTTIQGAVAGQTINFAEVIDKVMLALGLIVAKSYNVSGTTKF